MAQSYLQSIVGQVMGHLNPYCKNPSPKVITVNKKDGIDFVADLEVNREKIVIETFRDQHQILSAIKQFSENFKFSPGCFLNMLGIK